MDLEALRARLRLDASGFTAGMAEAQGALGRFQNKMRSVGDGLRTLGADMRRIGAIATAAITVPIITGAGKIVMAASDLNEAISATNAVFGGSAKGILDWSKSSANNLGISREAALSAAVGFAGLGKTAGYTGDDLNTFSTDIIQAASDLGSFYNVDPGTVLQDLRSGLAGESEPLRKYGIFLTEASVAQKAMEMTGKANAEQLTEGDKIAARSALILAGLGDAQGDFAKTSKGLANTLRRLRARSVDLAAKWGTVLLPIAIKIADAVGKIMDKFEEISPRMQKFALIVVSVAAAIGPLLIVLGFLAPGFALLLSPIGLVVVALSGLATFLPGVRSAIMEFVGALVGGKGLADALRAIGGDDTPKFIVKLAKIIDIVVQLGTYLYDIATGKIKPFGDQLKKLPKWLQPIAYVLGRVVKSIRVFLKVLGRDGLRGALAILPTQFKALRGALDKLFASVGLTGFWNVLKTVIGDIFDIIQAVVSFVDNVIHGRWGAAWRDLGTIVQNAIAILGTVLGALWDVIKLAFNAIDWGWLGQQGIAIVKAVWNAIDWAAVGRTIWAGIQGAFGFVKTAGQWLAERGLELLNYVFDLDYAAIGGTVWEGIKTALTAVGELALGAAQFLAEQGYALLKGLWNLDWGQVATDVWNGLWTAIQAVKQLGAIALDAVIELAGDLKDLRDDAATWVKTALNWTGDKTVEVGKLTIQSDVQIVDTTGAEVDSDEKGWKDKILGFAAAVPAAMDSAVRGAFTAGTVLEDLAIWIVGKLVDGLVFAVENISQEKIKLVGAGIVAVLAGFLTSAQFILLPINMATALAAGFVSALAEDFVKAVGDPLREWVGNIIKTVKDALGISSPSTVFAEIGGELQAGLVSGLDFSRIFNYFWSIGRAVTGGLISGIASLWSEYVAQLNRLIQAALRIKAALGIASPSKFMKGVFEDYMAGAVMAIEAGMPAFARAVDKMNTTAMGQRLTPGTPILAAMPAFASANGEHVRSIVIEKGAIVVNAAPGQREEVIAEKVATKILRARDQYRAGQR